MVFRRQAVTLPVCTQNVGSLRVIRYLKQAEPQSRQSNRELSETVRRMLEDVEQHRDEAVKRYAQQLDSWSNPTFRVSDTEIAAARTAMSSVFKEDFAFCKKQVTDFAKRQRDSIQEFEDTFGDGITLGQKITPVDNVGCYIPGLAPSNLLMVQQAASNSRSSPAVGPV
jgi:sulfopropanediol 3-dehydrogenase